MATTKKTYPKMTKKDIKELAFKIVEVLSKENLASDLRVYYNNKCLQTRLKSDANCNFWYETEEIDDISPLDYFKYAATKHIISISTEGGLYDRLNYGPNSFPQQLEKLFEYWGIYWELGDSWNLSFFPFDEEEGRIEYTVYEEPAKPIHIHYNCREGCPTELLPVMDAWWNLSSLTGDGGACVIGAMISFDYKDKKYEMSACSPYQGEWSWREHVPLIMRLLQAMGATNISFDAGRLD